MKALFIAMVLGVFTVGASLRADDMPAAGQAQPDSQVQQEVKKEEKKEVRKGRRASKKKVKKIQESTTTQPSDSAPVPDAPAGEAVAQ